MADMSDKMKGSEVGYVMARTIRRGMPGECEESVRRLLWGAV